MRIPGRVVALLLLSFIFVAPLQAQLLMPVRKATGNFFRLGIKGGVSLTNLTLDGLSVNGASDYIAKSMTAKNGYVAGIYARIGRRVLRLVDQGVNRAAIHAWQPSVVGR